jgi:RNA polymerase sigma-70 factor, ECF subfamily
MTKAGTPRIKASRKTRATTTEPARVRTGRLSAEAAGARLSELFEDHGRMVYGLCRLLLRDTHEAEDAAQQVFLSAHRSVLGGTEPREPAAWLGAIARNECRGRIRGRMSTPIAPVAERAAVDGDVEHLAGQRAEIEALCAALAALPAPQREAIVLREFYGLSYEEVRAALGVTDAAVESLLFRARKRLQIELRPARVASGAIALPMALRDALAGAVPGFASASSGGLLGKLASLPLGAKLAATAAVLTASGAIGVVGLGVHGRVPAADRPHASAQLGRKVVAATPGGTEMHLTRAPVAAPLPTPPVAQHRAPTGDAEDAEGVGGHEAAGEEEVEAEPEAVEVEVEEEEEQQEQEQEGENPSAAEPEDQPTFEQADEPDEPDAASESDED